jgi:hypothetical protein
MRSGRRREDRGPHRPARTVGKMAHAGGSDEALCPRHHVLAAEVLVLGVLDPTLAEDLIGQVIGVQVCLRMASPAISRVGSGGWPGSSVWTSPKRPSRNRQSTVRASFASA